MASENLIIFSDLDGTLLDLGSYSYRGAEGTLNMIRERKIPLIFCSAKTRTEQEFYQRKLHVHHPFIVENGGAIFIPNDYFEFDHNFQRSDAAYRIHEIGLPYKTIREKLIRIRNENGFEFRGYGDMSLEEVSDLTGLDREAAQRAMAREYSETINLLDPRISHRLKSSLREHDLQCSHGGRLQTVTAMSNDKGNAVKILKRFYRKSYGAITTFGIGDSMNDLPLLSEVDFPILLQRPEEKWLEVDLPNLKKMTGSGPEVWARALSEILPHRP